MIYLRRTDEAQEVYIPKTIAGACEKLPVRLALKGTVSLTAEASSVTDTGERRNYYVVSLTLPADCPAGEYEYRLTFYDLELASGVAVVADGEYNARNIEYKAVTEYEQYEAQ